jgi:hypothetical protein
MTLSGRCRPDKRSAIRQYLTARPHFPPPGRVPPTRAVVICRSDKLRTNRKKCGGADAYRAYGSRCSRCRPDKRSAIRQCLTARPNYRHRDVSHRREPLSFCQSDKLRANRQKCPVALTLTGPVGIAVVVVGRISAAPSGNTSPPDRIFRHRDESHRREPLSFIGRINSVPTEKCPLTLTGPTGVAVVVVGRISAAPSGNASPPDRITATGGVPPARAVVVLSVG